MDPVTLSLLAAVALTLFFVASIIGFFRWRKVRAESAWNDEDASPRYRNGHGSSGNTHSFRQKSSVDYAQVPQKASTGAPQPAQQPQRPSIGQTGYTLTLGS